MRSPFSSLFFLAAVSALCATAQAQINQNNCQFAPFVVGPGTYAVTVA